VHAVRPIKKTGSACKVAVRPGPKPASDATMTQRRRRRACVSGDLIGQKIPRWHLVLDRRVPQRATFQFWHRQVFAPGWG